MLCPWLGVTFDIGSPDLKERKEEVFFGVKGQED
jgi:hypothetical protein